ncbi:MAG: MarR family transcriptional regulator [Comamonadaceae bacterium]|nr:MAG: MarR family transcriptional regulator [Comamonadaceae bacterium]
MGSASASPARAPGRKAAVRLLDDQTIGLEGRARADDHQSLRLWLRLLSCSTQVETEIRRRLRVEFGMSLARFDYLAQLHRHTEGLGMSALSRYLMVTGGNVTGLTDQLEKEGWVERSAEPGDRRSLRVTLTEWGRSRFEQIATTHEAWVVDIFAGVSSADRRQLQSLLGALRVDISARLAADPRRA